jgi:phosphoglycerate dehydrogenase-like enzyme
MLRVLVPSQLGERRRDAVRATCSRIELATLRIDQGRPPWSRAVRFAARRWLPYPLYGALRPVLDGRERLSLRVDGAPLAQGHGVEVLLASWALGAGAARRVVDALPDLRWIHSTSTGVDRFDARQLRARGIQLTAACGVHSRRIAEFVMSVVYSDAKRIDEHWRGAWRGGGGHRRSTELRTLTMGVVGYGSIGREVARLARANGLRVVALVRRPARAPSLVEGVETTSELGEVLAASDVLVLALPLNDSTRGLVGRSAFRSMRRGALLVNVGRAGTVVEPELLRALRDGTLRRAYLDVVDDRDDVPPNHPLLRAPNALYTWHSAAASAAADEEVFAGFLENLRRYCEGRPLLAAQPLGDEPAGDGARRAEG